MGYFRLTRLGRSPYYADVDVEANSAPFSVALGTGYPLRFSHPYRVLASGFLVSSGRSLLSPLCAADQAAADGEVDQHRLEYE